MDAQNPNQHLVSDGPDQVPQNDDVEPSRSQSDLDQQENDFEDANIMNSNNAAGGSVGANSASMQNQDPTIQNIQYSNDPHNEYEEEADLEQSQNQISDAPQLSDALAAQQQSQQISGGFEDGQAQMMYHQQQEKIQHIQMLQEKARMAKQQQQYFQENQDATKNESYESDVAMQLGKGSNSRSGSATFNQQREAAMKKAQQNNMIQRQSIAPGFAPDQNKQGLANSAAPNVTRKSMPVSSKKAHASNIIDLNDINLRLSENLALVEGSVKRNRHLAEDEDGESQVQISEEKAASPREFTNLADKCSGHAQDYILFCLKCQEKICTKCLDTNHLLHPVVPLNSVNKLDFKTSLQKEIEKSLEDIKHRESVVQNKIGRDLTKHKIALRNHVIFVRDTLRNEFDGFFNNMLSSIRGDWNLFEMQEQLSKETSKFSKEILQQLGQITQQDEFEQIYYHNDLKKFYENLSGAQSKVQDYKQKWSEFEQGVDCMVDGLKGYSEFDIIDGSTLKNFLAENLVMNYSNVEIHKLLFQQMITGKQNGSQNSFAGAQTGSQGVPGFGNLGGSAQNARGRSGTNDVPGERIGNSGGGGRQQSFNRGSNPSGGHQSQIVSGAHGQGARLESMARQNQQPGEHQQNICFNRNSQLAMANNFEETGIRMLNRPQNQKHLQHEDAIRTNKIHFFKFDQKIVTFYNVDHERKQREVLNIDFNIPIRFCSIQTNDGRIFITGGAKNTSQSSNHAYEFRNGTLIQLPNMINPREGHCLAAVGNSHIYAIGSRLYNTSKTCEVYSIENNCWREKPELNRNRYLSTAVTIQQRYIYVFGGYEPSVTDIERLDTVSSDPPAYWELIKVWSSSLEADIKYWFGACPISQHEILIFGGKKDGASSCSSYVFDTQQNQIAKTANLPNKDTFYQRTFLCKNGKVYAYGYENDYAYIYNLGLKTWTKK